MELIKRFNTAVASGEFLTPVQVAEGCGFSRQHAYGVVLRARKNLILNTEGLTLRFVRPEWVNLDPPSAYTMSDDEAEQLFTFLQNGVNGGWLQNTTQMLRKGSHSTRAGLAYAAKNGTLDNIDAFRVGSHWLFWLK